MKTGFTQLKDADRLILDAADDRTLLEILKVNKNLLVLGEDAFKKRMQQKYPVLAKLKPYWTKWAKYYLDMVYYINKLKEDYNIDYIPVSSFDPHGYLQSKQYEKIFDKNLNDLREASHRAEILAELGDEKLIREWMDKNPKFSYFALAFLLKYKNISLFEKLYTKKPVVNVKYFNPNYDVSPRSLFLEEAAESGDINMVIFVLKLTGHESILPGDEESIVKGAAKAGDFNMLSHVEIGDFMDVLEPAAQKGQIEFIKAFLQPKNYKLLLWILPKVIENLVYSETTNVLSPEKTEKTLRFLLDTYFSLGGKKKKFRIYPAEELQNKRIVSIFKEYGL